MKKSIGVIPPDINKESTGLHVFTRLAVCPISQTVFVTARTPPLNPPPYLATVAQPLIVQKLIAPFQRRAFRFRFLPSSLAISGGTLRWTGHRYCINCVASAVRRSITLCGGGRLCTTSGMIGAADLLHLIDAVAVFYRVVFVTTWC